MLSLAADIAASSLSETSRNRLIALEDRAIVSLRAHLRALLWLGVALISAGAGTLLARNIETIGHLTLIVAIAVAAAGCYAFAWRLARRRRQEATGEGAPSASRTPPVVAEYVLLLGALLFSADLAYAEAQIGILGQGWRWHLLILAIAHGAAAYLFASRMVLTLAIVALAGLFGVDREGDVFGETAAEAAARFATAGAAVAAWRVVHQRLSRLRSFDFPLEQAAFHLAMIGAIAAIFDDSLWLLGLAAALGLAALGSLHAVRTREESFLVFAVLYAVFAIDAAVVPRLRGFMVAQAWLALTTPIAIVALFLLHRTWKERFE
jgi:hypothetical protein